MQSQWSNDQYWSHAALLSDPKGGEAFQTVISRKNEGSQLRLPHKVSSAPPDETHTSKGVTQRKKKEEHALWDPSNLDASKNPFACDRAAKHCSLRHALHQIVYWEYTKREPPFKHFLNEENKLEIKINFKTPSNSYHEQLDLEHFSSNSQVDDLL